MGEGPDQRAELQLLRGARRQVVLDVGQLLVQVDQRLCLGWGCVLGWDDEQDGRCNVVGCGVLCRGVWWGEMGERARTAGV